MDAEPFREFGLFEYERLSRSLELLCGHAIY
jgi:hypothetical protein